MGPRPPADSTHRWAAGSETPRSSESTTGHTCDAELCAVPVQLEKRMLCVRGLLLPLWSRLGGASACQVVQVAAADVLIRMPTRTRSDTSLQHRCSRNLCRLHEQQDVALSRKAHCDLEILLWSLSPLHLGRLRSSCTLRASPTETVGNAIM